MNGKKYKQIAVTITTAKGKFMDENAKEALINSFNGIAGALGMSDLFIVSINDNECVEFIEPNPHDDR